MSTEQKCHQCGRELSAETRFCPYCGIDKPHLATFLSQREGLVALAVTLAWTLLILLFKSYEYSLLLLLLSVLVLLPAVCSLSSAIYRTWSSKRLASLAGRTLDPSVASVIALTWLLVVSLLLSDPGENVVTAALAWVYTLTVPLLWLVIFAASLNLIVASKWTIVRRIGWTVVSLLPLTGAIYLGAYVIYEDGVLLQARFDISESALDRHVRRPEPDTGRVGLYQITLVTEVEECTFLETGGDSLDEGFAYCPHELPSAANGGSPPALVMGSLSDDSEDADWWTYNFTKSGY
jgi:hypothetical protein